MILTSEMGGLVPLSGFGGGCGGRGFMEEGEVECVDGRLCMHAGIHVCNVREGKIVQRWTLVVSDMYTVHTVHDIQYIGYRYS